MDAMSYLQSKYTYEVDVETTDPRLLAEDWNVFRREDEETLRREEEEKRRREEEEMRRRKEEVRRVQQEEEMRRRQEEEQHQRYAALVAMNPSQINAPSNYTSPPSHNPVFNHNHYHMHQGPSVVQNHGYLQRQQPLYQPYSAQPQANQQYQGHTKQYQNLQPKQTEGIVETSTSEPSNAQTSEKRKRDSSSFGKETYKHYKNGNYLLWYRCPGCDNIYDNRRRAKRCIQKHQHEVNPEGGILPALAPVSHPTGVAALGLYLQQSEDENNYFLNRESIKISQVEWANWVPWTNAFLDPINYPGCRDSLKPVYPKTDKNTKARYLNPPGNGSRFVNHGVPAVYSEATAHGGPIDLGGASGTASYAQPYLQADPPKREMRGMEGSFSMYEQSSQIPAGGFQSATEQQDITQGRAKQRKLAHGGLMGEVAPMPLMSQGDIPTGAGSMYHGRGGYNGAVPIISMGEMPSTSASAHEVAITQQQSEQPPKRGRGRPRKHPLLNAAFHNTIPKVKAAATKKGKQAEHDQESEGGYAQEKYQSLLPSAAPSQSHQQPLMSGTAPQSVYSSFEPLLPQEKGLTDHNNPQQDNQESKAGYPAYAKELLSVGPARQAYEQFKNNPALQPSMQRTVLTNAVSQQRAQQPAMTTRITRRMSQRLNPSLAQQPYQSPYQPVNTLTPAPMSADQRASALPGQQRTTQWVARQDYFPGEVRVLSFRKEEVIYILSKHEELSETDPLKQWWKCKNSSGVMGFAKPEMLKEVVKN